MEEVEVPPEAEAILLGYTEQNNSAGASEIKAFYKGKAQNGNKLVGQADGYQIKYDQNEDKFYIVT
ncbi:hypothetical protein [Spirosoma utsteinense]|uniref:Uncharacterized protein n=1 Tax=Spirosoma utsteinense TaxID=2585773 RepID=A0ABR6W7S3_9BACT|nr:hypothetical protein [Spirosoma utsteinense]MBC3789043.1 hypothetical protein [Spirosoma utsteinense]MBC3792631.1 hypothetical protein [Spirosoma utsteinense]